MTEYERGFKDGVTSKMNKELQPLLSEILTGISEAIKNTPKYLIDNMELEASDRGYGHIELFSDKESYECFKVCGIAYDGECSICGSRVFRTDKYCAICGGKLEGKNESNN